ncbi:unnamed protein product [Linum tenue]|uniref:Uncharacterized protein n=1 Tax=Linum tenue TaxID=586396 RepID=A0AAV0P5J5_9ROSI|nr:unnamed protein product [Linum tenue]
MVMKLALKTGLVPNFNICAALVGFVFVKTWSRFGSYLLGMNKKTYEQYETNSEGNNQMNIKSPLLFG